jgi:hypothetical protein
MINFLPLEKVVGVMESSSSSLHAYGHFNTDNCFIGYILALDEYAVRENRGNTLGLSGPEAEHYCLTSLTS